MFSPQRDICMLALHVLFICSFFVYDSHNAVAMLRLRFIISASHMITKLHDSVAFCSFFQKTPFHLSVTNLNSETYNVEGMLHYRYFSSLIWLTSVLSMQFSETFSVQSCKPTGINSLLMNVIYKVLHGYMLIQSADYSNVLTDS